MKRTTKLSIIICCLMILNACQSNKKPSEDTTETTARQTLDANKAQLQQQELSQLVQLMSGTFDSFQQSQQDDSYFHISLKMKPVWLSRGNGHWLYVEQAVGNMPDKPYRQRIYHVTTTDNGKFSSAVYELPDPQAVIGAYERPELLSGVLIKDLKLRTGCAVILSKTAINQYQGSTHKKSCLSQLRGASYATSKVVITESGISSWDQGFDANDEQVWGAVTGPYVFDRK